MTAVPFLQHKECAHVQSEASLILGLLELASNLLHAPESLSAALSKGQVGGAYTRAQRVSEGQCNTHHGPEVQLERDDVPE